MNLIGSSAKMKVVARGPAIEVRMNGEKILQARDTTFQKRLHRFPRLWLG
jgi:hypothetical protein